MSESTADEIAEDSNPRLIALLFAEWASETQSGKHALCGIFDRIMIVSGSQEPFTFFLYIRTMQAYTEKAADPIEINIVAPNSIRVGSLYIEALEPERTLPESYPFIVQGIVPIMLTLDQTGIYWFHVIHHGQFLGMAPLIVMESSEVSSDAM